MPLVEERHVHLKSCQQKYFRLVCSCFNSTPALAHNSLISKSVFSPQFLKPLITRNDSLPISETLRLFFVMGNVFYTPNAFELL